MAERFVNDDPGNRCFGCSPHNERGLRMVFWRTGPDTVECRYEAPAHLCGAPGVVHGGVQAALLDEVIGNAIHRGVPDGEELDIVTVDFRLRYRRPVPTGQPLLVRGRFLRADGDDYYAEGEICGPGGEVLTRAEARWHRIERRALA